MLENWIYGAILFFAPIALAYWPFDGEPKEDRPTFIIGTVGALVIYGLVCYETFEKLGLAAMLPPLSYPAYIQLVLN